MSILLVELDVFFILSVVTLVSSFFAFDRLIRYQFEAHRAEWEQNGRSRGYFWLPTEYWNSQPVEGISQWKLRRDSSSAFQKVILTWMFSTPVWTKKDEIAGKLLKRFRLLVFLGNGGLLLCIFLLMTNAIG